MIPGNQDYTCVRGTTQAFIWGIKVDDPDNPGEKIPIPATAYRLTIKSGSTILHKRTDDPASGFVLDPATGVATWIPTPAETHAFVLPDPDDAEVNNFYELEVWNTPASQMVYLSGKIVAIGGLNDDA